MSFFRALHRHNQLFSRIGEMAEVAGKLADQVHSCLMAGGKILFMGNGGSAADAQHLAAEFVVRYKAERRPLAALALNIDTSILTAHSNDYDFSTVFNRQIEALCRPADLVIGLSTSGNSANVINGVRAAQAIGAVGWGWTGESGGELGSIADHMLRIPSTETARIQEAHMFIGHWLCEEMDSRVAAA